MGSKFEYPGFSRPDSYRDRDSGVTGSEKSELFYLMNFRSRISGLLIDLKFFCFNCTDRFNDFVDYKIHVNLSDIFGADLSPVAA